MTDTLIYAKFGITLGHFVIEQDTPPKIGEHVNVRDGGDPRWQRAVVTDIIESEFQPNGKRYILASPIDLFSIMTIPEISETFKITHEAVRQAIKTKRLVEGEDYRKSGSTYLVKRLSAERLWQTGDDRT